MSRIIGWQVNMSSRADNAAWESEYIVKVPAGRVKSVLTAKRMAESSAVKIEAREGRLPERENSGKTAPNPTPASDLEPSVNTGMDVA